MALLLPVAVGLFEKADRAIVVACAHTVGGEHQAYIEMTPCMCEKKPRCALFPIT